MQILTTNNINFNGVWQIRGEKYTPIQREICKDIEKKMYAPYKYDKNAVQILKEKEKGLAMRPHSDYAIDVSIVEEKNFPVFANSSKVGRYTKTGQFKQKDLLLLDKIKHALAIAALILACILGAVAANSAKKYYSYCPKDKNIPITKNTEKYIIKFLA